MSEAEVPIRLHKIPATHFRKHDIVFPDQPLLACRFAEKFGAWVRDIAANGKISADA